MKTITLLKDHENPQGKFPAGSVLEVEDSEYDWLMASYMSERMEQVAKEQAAREEYEQIARVLNDR